MRYILLISIVFTMSACINSLSQDKITEGSIVYEIKYLDDERKNPFIILLPTTMQMSFKNDNTISRIQDGLGFFGYAYIANPEEDKNSTLLNLFGEKVYHQVGLGQPAFGFDRLEDVVIEKQRESKKIIGFDCNKAIVTCSNKTDSIILYYTNEIEIKNPNANNPYMGIDGVLLEFEVYLLDIHMQFIAKELLQREVQNEEFIIPEDYIHVTIDEMEEKVKPYKRAGKKKESS